MDDRGEEEVSDRKPREFLIAKEPNSNRALVFDTGGVIPLGISPDSLILFREVLPDEIDHKKEWLNTEKELADWRALAKELAEALKSAKGLVVTHAMQTYNKRADQEAYEINILLQKFEQAVEEK